MVNRLLSELNRWMCRGRDLCLVVAAMLAFAGVGQGAVVYDFEESAEGWTYTKSANARLESSTAVSQRGVASLKVDVQFPGEGEVSARLNRANWSAYDEVAVSIFLPSNAPRSTQALLFIKDRDHRWYQALAPQNLRPGWNRVKASLAADSKDWEYRGHFRPWNDDSRRAVLEFGVRVFSKEGTFTGSVFLDDVAVTRTNHRSNNTPMASSNGGFIRGLRANVAQVGRYEKFEVTFDLPKQYANPFTPDEIAVDATFIGPNGERLEVPGFYFEDFVWESNEFGEKMTPLGKGCWKVRFAPTAVGRWTYQIRVRDSEVSAETPTLAFECVPSENRGYIRVEQEVPGEGRRYFELSNGDFFFSIGHNIRSPFDERYASAPWATLRQRQNEGLAAYNRYFERMGANGANMAEIWMASWWLALEWKANAPGYHGVGYYNTRHAWKLDYLLERARQNGIYLLLVINNHGKFSTFCDAEWSSNPFNRANGGPFDSPDEFFTSSRGKKAFRDLLRYMVARWGYDTQVFGWKLFSEINLTGSNQGFHRTPAMIHWHQEMGAYLKELDPWKHPVTTHYSSDYRVQDPRLVSLPALDFSTVDAYHGVPNSLRIIELINETAQFNRQFNKPVLITEFGGSPGGMRANLLQHELHNALWTSVCSPSAGTPMFWWWMFIDENDFYRFYKPIAAFMRGEDRRGAGLELASDAVELSGPTAHSMGVQPLLSERRAYVWLYDRDFFNGPMYRDQMTRHDELQLRLLRMNDGEYAVEVWNTETGEVMASLRAESHEGVLEFDLPAFQKDVAVKVKPVENP